MRGGLIKSNLIQNSRLKGDFVKFKILSTYITSLAMGLLISVASADEVTVMLDEAKAAYIKEDFQLSLVRMQQATTIVRELQNETLGKLFPPPMSGWKKVQPKDKDENLLSKAMDLGVASGIAGRYEKDAQFVQLALVNNPPPLVALTLSAMQSVASVAAGNEKVTVKGSGEVVYSGVVQCSDKEACHVVLPLANGFYLMAYSNITAKVDMLSYVQAFNVTALENHN